MAKRVTRNNIVKAVGSKHLELVRGAGYHYFVYDNPAKPSLYETRSVMSFDLGQTQKDFDFWVSEARGFLDHVEGRVG